MADTKKILIIEDEPFLSDMYRTKFETLGYSVIDADTGEDGINMMRSEKPDMVLLDIIMPVLDGYEVLRRVRSDNDLKDQLIVIFSNLGQDEEITKGLQMGADDYLVKSNLTPSQLVEKVEMILERGRVPRKEVESIRVLIVADDHDIVEDYSKRFEKEGFEFRVVEQGAYGLKVAQSEPYDVVVYDAATSDVEPKEVVSTLRQTPKMHDVPVLVLSDDTSDETVAELVDAGATDVFLKPRLTESQLVNRIRELIK